jgi:hypothetical protein
MSSDSEDEDAFLLPKRNGRALSVSDSSEEEDLSGGATTMDAIEVRTKKSSKAFAEKAPTAIAGTKEVRTAMYEAFKFTIDTSTPVFAKIFDPATDESKKDFDKRLHKAEAELIDPNDAKTSSTIDAMENLVFACSAVFHVCELINLSTATAVDMVVGKNTTENIVETTRQKEIKPIKSVSFTHQNHFMSQVSSIQSTKNQTFRPSYLISSWRRRQLTLRRGSARNLTPTCQDLTK